jgi:arylsulfatase A-like enzyme
LPGELYDLQNDLSQRQNQYAERPEKVAEMSQLLQRIRQAGQVRTATRGD